MNVSDEGKAPLLRVVGGGEPTDEELAAVVIAIASVAAADNRQQPTPSRWAARAPRLRQSLHPGPGAWKASALPR